MCFTIALEGLAPPSWLLCLCTTGVSAAFWLLFFRWYQRDWVCSHQDVYEAQKYRVQAPAVLKVSGSVPGPALEVPLSCAAGEHVQLFISTGLSAGLCPCHWEQCSSCSTSGAVNMQGFTMHLWGWASSPQITSQCCKFPLSVPVAQCWAGGCWCDQLTCLCFRTLSFVAKF